MRVDLAVIGGGLVGLAVAWEARQRGMSVRVIEGAQCGRHASSASAGGVRSLNRHMAEIPLARAALKQWRMLGRRLGHDVGFVQAGQVRLAEDDAAIAALQARVDTLTAAGWTHERIMSAEALRARLPASAPHCRGALVVADDGFADPLATVHAYRRACLESGVALTENCAVRDISRVPESGLVIDTAHGEVHADRVANCAGAWGGDLVAGERVAMRTAALQMIVTAPVARFVTQVVGVHGRKLSLKQTEAGAVVIGGGFEGDLRDGHDCPTARGRVDPQRVGANLANAVAVFPHLEHARVLRAWSGLEGMMPDGLPVLGPSARIEGLVHAFGFSAHGFALVPVIGRMVAELLDTGRSDPSMAPFTVTRFAAQEPRRGPSDTAAIHAEMNDA